MNRCAGVLIVSLVVASLMVTSPAAAQPPQGPMDPALSAPEGYEGRIRLTRFLDEPDGYCLDVPGPVSNLFLDWPMWAHTCHPDPFADQVFRFNKDGAGRLHWVFEAHDLCVTANTAEAGAGFKLAACDQPAVQSFDYTETGQFRLKDTELCINVEKTGPGPRQPVAEGQDARGRGQAINPQYSHLARKLELQPCTEGDRAMSRWRSIY